MNQQTLDKQDELLAQQKDQLKAIWLNQLKAFIATEQANQHNSNVVLACLGRLEKLVKTLY